MQTSITLTRPDDWHLHLRDGDLLAHVVPASAKRFARAVVMPNLTPPITTTVAAQAYRERILRAVPPGSAFEPLMTLYLTDATLPDEIRHAKKAGIIGCKLYPAGATTNSASGVTDIARIESVLEAMAEEGVPLLVHGEVTDADVDIFDREARFIERVLEPVMERISGLRVVLEHVTTAEGVQFVQSRATNLAATITPQHLLYNRNHLLVGGIHPHLYCLPILKRQRHQEALQKAATEGDRRFFLGTDSAPHARDRKESPCGCAGCYSAYSAIELYAEIFDGLGALDKLEAFASHHGPDFYGLPRNSDTITLVRSPWQLPEKLSFGQTELVPLGAGGELHWQIHRGESHWDPKEDE